MTRPGEDKRGVKRGSFSTRAILVIMLTAITALPVLAASVLFYHYERNALITNTTNYEQRLVDTTATELATLFDQFDKIRHELTSFCLQLKIQKLDYTSYTAQDFANIRLLETLMQSMFRTIDGVSNIYFISLAEPRIAYSGKISMFPARLLSKPWIHDVRYENTEWDIIDVHDVDYDNSPTTSSHGYWPKAFSFVSGLLDSDMNGDFEFLIQIDLDANKLRGRIGAMLTEDMDGYVIKDGQGRVFLSEHYLDHAQRAMLDTGIEQVKTRGSGLLVNGSELFSMARIKGSDLTIYKFKHLDMVDGSRRIAGQIIWIACLSLTAAVVLAFVFSYSITQPVRKLLDETMQRIEINGNLTPVRIRSSNKDIQSIGVGFNHMVERVNTLISEALAREMEKQDIELKMLQAQINPHFLYNTLNSIKWMALISNNRDIADSVVSLVKLLEYCCKQPDRIVTVSQEVDFVREYVALQSMRYRSNVDVRFSMEETVLPLYMPKFILQPSVENALLHAFGPDSSDARVTIGGRLENGDLFFEIKDNGCGYDVEHVQKNLTGIGTENVDERIRLLYGEAYGQHIQSAEGIGTTVTIHLPVMRQKEDGISV